MGKSGTRKLSLVKEDQARGHLNQLEIQKSTLPDGMYPETLSELANIIAKPLLIIFEGSWGTLPSTIVTSRLKGVILPLYSDMMRYIWSPRSRSGLSSTRDTWQTGGSLVMSLKDY